LPIATVILREACQLHLDLSASLWGVRTTRFRRPRTAPFVLGTSASTASPLRVCDVRDTPLVSKRDVAMIADFQKNTSGIFLRAELDELLIPGGERCATAEITARRALLVRRPSHDLTLRILHT
jgi:hypothetical protein